jgi:hypothetical protein
MRQLKVSTCSRAILLRLARLVREQHVEKTGSLLLLRYYVK